MILPSARLVLEDKYILFGTGLYNPVKCQVSSGRQVHALWNRTLIILPSARSIMKNKYILCRTGR